MEKIDKFAEPIAEYGVSSNSARASNADDDMPIGCISVDAYFDMLRTMVKKGR